MAKERLTPERVRELLDYDPKTGEIRHRKRLGNERLTKVWNTKYAGKTAGVLTKEGRWQITLLGRSYKGHQLAWVCHYGEWPKIEIDHENRVASDNRIKNLRLASRSQNAANKGIQANNTTGHRGIRPRFGKWHVQITVDRKYTWIGSFKTIDEAIQARDAALEKAFGEFAKA